jgi:hypothetical protein
MTRAEIEQIAREAAAQYGLPADVFLRLINQESGFKIDALSSKGAYGPAQLMPDTAAELGVNREDPRENIFGGAKYLRQQLDRFGQMPLALAAYNAGAGNVEKYGGIPPFKETQGYIQSILGSMDGQPLSAMRNTNMSMNPNAPQRTGLLGALDILRKPDPATGMTGMQRLGRALDPLLPQSQRMGERFEAMGARNLAQQSRNTTIETLKKRASSGDQLAAMVLQGLQSGAYDARTAMSMYMQEMMKGGISKSDMNKMVVDARKEFTGLAPVKDFADVSFAYSRVVRSADNPSPAGDLALIFNFMKVLDPGSVVREGEFATAQNAGGIDERVRSLYNQVVEGTRLTEAQRADFVDRAGRLYGGAQEQYQSIANQYTEFARQAGLDPQLVIPDFSFKGTVPEKPTILQVPPNPMPDRFPTDADWKNHWQNVMSEEERKEFLGG